MPTATVLCQSTAVCRTFDFLRDRAIALKTMFTKLEQRLKMKIEVARHRSTQEYFHGLREALGGT